MQAVVAVLFIAPLGAALIGVLLFVWYRLREAIRDWRDERSAGIYVPSRVWFDDRYGGPDADPHRYLDGTELPPVRTLPDPRSVTHLPTARRGPS